MALCVLSTKKTYIVLVDITDWLLYMSDGQLPGANFCPILKELFIVIYVSMSTKTCVLTDFTLNFHFSILISLQAGTVSRCRSSV